MAHGGARNRSGPPLDPTSNRSDARGVKLSELPNEGFKGDAPDFPLDSPSGRELEVWESLWSTPQAAAWAEESWRWQSVAMYARIFVRSEDPACPSGVLAQLHRFADQIGMTPAGLKENGWAIRQPDVNFSASAAPAKRRSARDRMKVVNE